MARRERERYTERTRPHRRDVDAPRSPGSHPGAASDGASGGGLGNPVVLIALFGFGLALVLAVAVMIGRNRAQAPSTAAGETPAATAETVATADAGAAPTTNTQPPTEESMAPAGMYSAPEAQNLDGEANAYFVTVETEKGTFKGELWPSLAPETVNSFVFLAREGFYDGLTIHRVEPGFVIQGGDPNGNGTGGPGYQIKGEFTDVPHVPGIFSMARTSDPNSAGSQFFVVTGEASHLNNQYAVFGYVYEGMDVVQSIEIGDVMTKVTIEEKPKAESVVSPDDVRAGAQPQG
jgi:peptidylprolyl isomerase